MADPLTRALAHAAALPTDAVAALFARWGRPLEAAPALDESVLLADGATRLARFRHRAPVDVIANDHVLLLDGGEPRALPAPLFAAAIAALARAAGLP